MADTDLVDAPCPACDRPMERGHLMGTGALWWHGPEGRQRLAVGVVRPPQLTGARCTACGTIVLAT